MQEIKLHLNKLHILAKEFVRKALGPFLPFVRRLRSLPKRQQANRLAAPMKKAVSGVSVCYLTRSFPIRPPLRTEFGHGGEVKMTFLAESFPQAFPQASILYTVSSVDHPGKTEIVSTAKKQGIKVIVNQNGVAYPAWHGNGWESPNQKQRETYQQADFIIYQSKFCQISAQKFLGANNAPFTVIYNPVDTGLYSPKPSINHNKAPVLLLGGNQFAPYRFECAVRALQHIHAHLPGTKLIVTGKLWGESQNISKEIALSWVKKLRVESYVEFTGPYSQKEAVSIFRGADILIHTQFQDASPGLVGEALACGLPVVYSDSGGTPELVGPEAGVGIPVEASWEKIDTPDPQKMAEGILKVWEDYSHYASAARQRALEQFSLKNYVQKHQEIFERLVE